MALAVGLALPLAARYLAAPFPTGARAVLAGLAATGTALLVWRRGQLDRLRFGLMLLIAALVVGQAWRGSRGGGGTWNPPGCTPPPQPRSARGRNRCRPPARRGKNARP